MAEPATNSDFQRLGHLIERQALVLTVRLGGLIIVGFGVLAALVELP